MEEVLVKAMVSEKEFDAFSEIYSSELSITTQKPGANCCLNQSYVPLTENENRGCHHTFPV